MNYTNNQVSTQPSQSYNQTPIQTSQRSSTTASSSNQTPNSTYPPSQPFNPYDPYPFFPYSPQYMPPQYFYPPPQFQSQLVNPTASSPSPHAHVASVQPVQSTNWYPDSGASHHVTNVSQNIQQATTFEGPDQITIGNGQGLNINALGVSSFHSPFNSKIPLTFKNLLFVPSITKNLLSVSQFCKDNSVFFEFHPNPVISAPALPTSVQSTAESPPLLVRPDNTPSICIRAKAGIVKPRLQPTLLLTHAEPKSTKSAPSNPTWHAAMKAEYDALLLNNTWTLVDLPSSRSPIGCKWYG